jgi:hypothetical protein
MRTERQVAADDFDEPTPAEQLVPLAQRDFSPSDFIETQQETVWYNPLDRDYVLDLHVGTKPMGPKLPPRNHEQKHGTRRYTIRAKDRRAIPAEFDIAIQHLQCQEYGCNMRSHHCRNPKHSRVIVGGLGPHLYNLGIQNRPVMAASLNEAEAEQKIAVETAMKAMLQTQAAENAMVISQARMKETTQKAEAARAKSEAEAADLREQLKTVTKNSKQKDQ